MLFQTQRTGDCYNITEDINEVIKAYSSMVYKIAFANLKNRDNADDIFQDVFLKYMQNKKPFDSEEHRKAWLIRVTVNCCKTFFTSPWNKGVGLDDIGDIPAEEDRTSSGNELMEKVLSLPPKLKNVILLFYYENMSVKEIAHALKTTEGSIKTRLNRARNLLKEELE